MKTKKELNQDILKMTLKIDELFPELSKYISEMPVKISYDKGNEKELVQLQNYFNSLDALLINYISNNKSITE